MTSDRVEFGLVKPDQQTKENIMNRLRLFIAGLALAGGLTTALVAADNPVTGEVEAAAAWAPNSYSNCAQSSAFGSRLCYDRGDRWIYVYYGGYGDTSVDLAFP